MIDRKKGGQSVGNQLAPLAAVAHWFVRGTGEFFEISCPVKRSSHASGNVLSVNPATTETRESIVKYLFACLLASLLLGCNFHSDSVYLGRKEAEFLGHVNRGDLAAVQEFLDQGGNVNLQDEPGMTPLHHAANGDGKGENLAMLKLLIDRGADANAIDDTHHRPLHLVHRKEAAELLIKAGADVNARTKRTGETVLFSAAHGAAQGHPKSHQRYLDLVKLLLAQGADVNVKLRSGSMIQDAKPYRAKRGDTTLHKVARSYSEEHASKVCELLIANGAKLNELNGKGQTPLDEALANGREKTAELLRKHGGRPGRSQPADQPVASMHEPNTRGLAKDSGFADSSKKEGRD